MDAKKISIAVVVTLTSLSGCGVFAGNSGSLPTEERSSDVVVGQVQEVGQLEAIKYDSAEIDTQGAIHVATITSPEASALDAAEMDPQAEVLKPAAQVVVTRPLPSVVNHSVSESVDAPIEDSSGWYIQMAAYQEDMTAESMKSALRERSERVTIQPATVNGSQYKRVLVGPYPTKQNAIIELDRVLGHGIFDGEPFVRHLP